MIRVRDKDALSLYEEGVTAIKKRMEQHKKVMER